jgi:spore coat polysaccharide biosynthesis protein SpsF
LAGGRAIWAVVTARMASTRLPGKHMLPLAGRPALARLLERLGRSRYLDGIMFATTTGSEDDVLERVATEAGARSFRGSAEDVLDRTVRAARSVDADVIVDITGDCPLVDHGIVDRVVDAFLERRPDYAANIIPPTYPNGMDVQVYPRSVLEEVDGLTRDPADREHVTLYIYEHPERYRLLNLTAPPEQHWPELRLTLDTREDYALISAVYDALFPERPDFTLDDVLALLRRDRALLDLNKDIVQKPLR